MSFIFMLLSDKKLQAMGVYIARLLAARTTNKIDDKAVEMIAKALEL